MTPNPAYRSSPARVALGAALALLGLAIAPSTGLAATSFGAKVNSQMQPSNSLPAHDCGDPTKTCTRVSLEAYTLGPGTGTPKAPKDGTIRKLKLIAGGPGHFRFELARARPQQQKAKIVRKGPRLSYEGQKPGDGFEVETFRVKVPVHKGDYLAIKARKTSMLRCSGGGPSQLLFQPALAVGGPFESADGTDGCFLLLEAVYG